MNFLAHLFLAGDSPQARVGSILPDLARPRPVVAQLPHTMAQAVYQHRLIDRFTDAHPIVARSKQRIRQRHGHFSAILIDVYYDHFLARDWRLHSDVPLRDFIAGAYADLAGQHAAMPASMAPIIQRMIAQDWLGCYTSVEGMAVCLRRMSHRLSQRLGREVKLEHAVADLCEQGQALGEDFRAFFPQLRAAVASEANLT
ncbi:MAG: ACP phosphodiesterase [Phycisphaeraceae bacterium]